MKRSLTIGLVLILALTASILAGCGGESTETTQAGMQATTTAESGTTAAPSTTATPSTTAAQESTTSTEMTTTTMPQPTETTQGGMGGVAVPEATPGTYTDLTPEQAKQLIDTTPDLVIVDVSPHYDEGHLPGAVGYYLGDGSLEAAIPTLDKSVPYLVYCHVDSVAIAGAQMLVDAGFPTVYRLQGNFSGWVAAGYPVEK